MRERERERERDRVQYTGTALIKALWFQAKVLIST